MTSPSVLEGNPDAPGCLLHFTGRTRADAILPPGRALTAEARLGSILTEGWLRGAPTFRTDYPVICFSELSDVALRHQLGRGFTHRGPYEPWGLVMQKAPLVLLGARPVWYVDSEEWKQTDSLPVKLRDRRVHSTPGGSVDWTHEREWRICAGPWPAGQEFGVPILNTPAMVTAVIVGRRGWLPHTAYRSDPSSGIARWWWNGNALQLDGFL